jgi:renalase
MDVLVIGAGMAGLRTATLRAAAGDRVIVVDKGRRHGGRMATRRVDDATFDTGALDVAAHGPAFRASCEAWAGAGHAAPAPDSPERWRGHPAMRSLPESLAAALTAAGDAEVRLATTVTGLAVEGGRWTVTLREGEAATTVGADALVVTAPAPQALALLRAGVALASDATVALLETVTYAPSITALVRPVDRALDGGALRNVDRTQLAGTDLARVHRDDLVGTSAVVALTLQATEAFSLTFLDGDRDAAARELTSQASRLVGVELEVVHVHGWRYAQVTRGIPMPALRDDTSGAPLVLAGDAFEAHGDAPSGVRPEGVERAFVSGGAAARLLDVA